MSKKHKVIARFSCGAASAVATKLAIKKYGEVVIYYNDTGSEHPDNVRFMKDCEKWFGQKVNVLTSNKFANIWEVFEARRYLSGPAGAPCTGELKRKPGEAVWNIGDIEIFGYTADVKVDETINGPDKNTSPLKRRFCEVINVDEDARQLAEDCMCHVCNNYCLQNTKNNTPRVCRQGFGTESKHGEEDTEGRQLISDHLIRVDKSGITHLDMKRTKSTRLQQHSRILLQTWRANIDVKCLLFETDPLQPNIREIDELIKYICAYTVKKNKTLNQEKEIIQDLIHK